MISYLQLGSTKIYNIYEYNSRLLMLSFCIQFDSFFFLLIFQIIFILVKPDRSELFCGFFFTYVIKFEIICFTSSFVWKMQMKCKVFVIEWSSECLCVGKCQCECKCECECVCVWCARALEKMSYKMNKGTSDRKVLDYPWKNMASLVWFLVSFVSYMNGSLHHQFWFFFCLCFWMCAIS